MVRLRCLVKESSKSSEVESLGSGAGGFYLGRGWTGGNIQATTTLTSEDERQPICVRDVKTTVEMRWL